MKGYPQYQFADYEAMHAPLSQGKVVLVYDQIPVERMPGFPCQVGRMMISFCFWEIHLVFFSNTFSTGRCGARGSCTRWPIPLSREATTRLSSTWHCYRCSRVRTNY